MFELLEWWNTAAQQLSPVLSSAILHYRFKAIHPFPDGNGRMGRALGVSRQGAMDLLRPLLAAGLVEKTGGKKQDAMFCATHGWTMVIARLPEQEQQEIIRFIEADKREVELVSVTHECLPGRRKIAVKVEDIFGNDTMTIIKMRI